MRVNISQNARQSPRQNNLLFCLNDFTGARETWSAQDWSGGSRGHSLNIRVTEECECEGVNEDRGVRRREKGREGERKGEGENWKGRVGEGERYILAFPFLFRELISCMAHYTKWACGRSNAPDCNMRLDAQLMTAVLCCAANGRESCGRIDVGLTD